MDEDSKDAQRALTRNETPASELCDICGGDQLCCRKCKLVCLNGRTVLKSCADL